MRENDGSNLKMVQLFTHLRMTRLQLTPERSRKRWEVSTGSKDAEVIERLVRGLNPWPSAYTYLNGKTLKIWAAAVKDETSDKEPGELTEVTKHSVGVQTGDGILMLEEVQLEGKKR